MTTKPLARRAYPRILLCLVGAAFLAAVPCGRAQDYPLDAANPFGLVVVTTNLDGSGYLVKSGPGTVVLLGTNTYIGGTTNNSGILRLLADQTNALASSGGTIAVRGGIFDLAGNLQETDTTVSFLGGAVRDGTIAHTGALNFDAQAGLVAANLSGNGLDKTGAGTLLLLGDNTYGFDTTLFDGTVGVVRRSNLGDASNFLTFAGGTLQIFGSALAGMDDLPALYDPTAAPVKLNIADTNHTFTIAGGLAGTSSLMKSGPGTLALGGNSTMSGGLTVNAGTLLVTGDNTMSGSMAVNAGTLVLTGDNSGMTGSTLVNGGVLQVGNGGTTGVLGGGAITNNSSLAFLRTDTITVTNHIAGTGGLDIRSGTVVLSNNTVSAGTANTPTAATYVGRLTNESGRLVVAGTSRLTGTAASGNNNGGISIGTYGRGVMVVQDSAFVQDRIVVGQFTGGAGAVYQLGGTVVNTGGTGADGGIGGPSSPGQGGTYGFWGLHGGALTNTGFNQIGGYGIGVMYQFGGSWAQTGNNLDINRQGTGIVYMAGGTFVESSGNLALGGNYGAGLAVVTVDGNARINTLGNSVQIDQKPNQVGIVNLNGNGTLQATQIYKSAVNATSLAILNFDGGTLQANGANLIGTGANALDGLYLYGNGGTINVSNFNVTLTQSILAPPGTGVTAIALGGPVSGYIGAPFVSLTGGGGTGATAIAQFDHNDGTVTGLLVTSRGYGYTSPPAVQLIGGGSSNYYVGAATLGANASGALTKQGGGNLVLAGTNTYTGGTTIGNGVLVFATSNALPATGSVTIGPAGALAATGALATANAWLGSGRIATASGGALALTAESALDTLDLAAAGYTNLFIGAMPGSRVVYDGTLTPVGSHFRLGGGGGMLAVTGALSGVDLTVGPAGGASNSTVWLDNASFSGAMTVNSNQTLSIRQAPGSGPLTMNGGTLQVHGGTLTDLAMPLNATADATVDISQPGLVTALSTNLTTAGRLTKTGVGTLAFSSSNNLAGAVSVVNGALRLQNSSALDGAGDGVVVSNGATVQLQGNVTLSDPLTLYGAGFGNGGALRNLSGSNTWAGPVTIVPATNAYANNIAGRIHSDAGLLTLSGPVTNNTVGLVSFFGGAGDTLVSGVLAGGGALGKDGAGTLTLAASNTYSGGTYFDRGTLKLDFSQPGAPVHQIIAATAGQLNFGNGTLQVVGAAGTHTQQFSSITLSPGNIVAGAGALVADSNGGTLVVALNGITRGTGGGILDLTLPANGAITTTSGASGTGIYDQLLTVGKTDWAAAAGGSPYKLTNYTAYTEVTANITNNANANERIAAGANAVLYPTALATSLKTLLSQDTTLAHTIDLGGTTNLVLGNPGAIMLAKDAAGLTVGSTVNGGILRSGGELNLINYSTNALVINAAITNGGNALTVNGTGPVTLNGTNVYTGATTINGGAVSFTSTNRLGAVTIRGGSLAFSGGTNLIAGTFTMQGDSVATINSPVTLGSTYVLELGNNLNARTKLTVNADLTSQTQVRIGYADNVNAAGALYLNAGTLAASGTYPLTLADGTASYGYVKVSGGTYAANGANFAIGWRGVGVFEQTGGAVTTLGTADVQLTQGGAATSVGILNVFGGGFGGPTNGIRFNVTGNARSLAQLTIANGGTVTAGTARATATVDLMAGAGNTGILNLNAGGKLIANQVKASGTGISLVNFDGGTLAASPTGGLASAFMQGLSGAYIYGGGATIDTDTGAVTIAQNLVGPDGWGLAGVTVADGGAGYIGAPAVRITGGTGTGATAIAQIDATSGALTNILITSRGSGYLNNDAPTVTIVGGGFAKSAELGLLTFGANANTGGLTKAGSGTLTLTGVNSYGGKTVMGAGTLVFNTASNQTLSGGLGGTAALVKNGTGTIVFGGDSSTFTGTTTINTGLLQFAQALAVPGGAGKMTVNPGAAVAFDFGGAGVAGALMSLDKASAGSVALTASSANETLDFSGTGAALTNAFLGAVGNVTYGGTHTPFAANAHRLGGGGGTLTYTNSIATGSLTVGGGAGTVITPNLGSGVAVALQNLSGVTWNLNGSNQTVASLSGGGTAGGNVLMGAGSLTVGDTSDTVFGGSISGTGGLTKVGSGRLTLTNSNTYVGSTVIGAGVLQLSSSATNFNGLYEANFAGNSNWIAVNPRNYVTNNTRMAFARTKPPWADNTTWAYEGYFYNNAGSNVTWTLGSLIDDFTRLVIDGVAIYTQQWSTALVTNLTLTPGAHSIDVRFSNGTGGAGADPSGWWSVANMGFAYDPMGRGEQIIGNYQPFPSATSNGTTLTTGLGYLPTLTPVYLAGGAALDMNGAAQIVSSLNDFGGSGGEVTNTATTPGYLNIVTYAGSNSTFSGGLTDGGAVSNALQLWVSGAGTQVLSGTNTHTGGTTVNGGVLQFAQASALSPNSKVTVNPGGAAALDFAGASAVLGRISGVSSGAVAITATTVNEALNFSAANLSNAYLGAVGDLTYTGTLTPYNNLYRLGGYGNLTYGQPIAGAVAVAIGGGPVGTVILATNNTYTGGTTIGMALPAGVNGGTLVIDRDLALGNVPVSPGTNVTFLGAGILRAGADGIALNVNRTILVASNSLGTVDVGGGHSMTINGSVTGANGTLAKAGAGTLTLNGTNNVSTILARNGTLVFSATGTNSISGGNNAIAQGLFAGAYAGDRGVVNFSGTGTATNVVVGTLRAGANTGAAGAFYQTGGTVLQNGGNASQDFAIGSGGGYGYYKITGGVALGNQIEIGAVPYSNAANTNSVGVMDILGGAVSPQSYFIIGRAGYGVVNVGNGGVLNGSPNYTGLAFGWDNGNAGGNGIGVLNVLDGGRVTANNNKVIDFSAQNGNGNPTGILNIGSNGVVQAYAIQRSQGAALSLLNFNGGTLVATSSVNGVLINANVATATDPRSGVYIYGGGAIIDTTNSANAYVNAALRAPTGYGVSGIALNDGGTNYIGAPAVKIAGGNGVGATAIAQLNAAGTITNILITSAGTGYLPGDALTVSLLGGGPTANGALGAITLAANSTGGGLTKLGSGLLALGGNNTYGGPTVVSNGTLQVGGAGATGWIPDNTVTFANSGSSLAFGRTDTVTNSLVVNGNIASIIQNGDGTLVLTNTSPNFGAMVVNTGNLVLASAAAMGGPGTNVTINGGGALVASGAYGSVNAWLASGRIATNSGGAIAMTAGANSDTFVMSTYTNLSIGAAKNQTATFLGTLTPATTNFLIGGGGGTLVLGVANQVSDSNLTVRSLTVGNGGGGIVQLLTPNNYSGGTVVNRGTLSVPSDASLGYGNLTLNGGSTLQIFNAPDFVTTKSLTLNTSAGIITLDIGAGSTATLFGAVSSSGNNDQYKTGEGTLILSNTVAALNSTGRWGVRQGTAIIDNGTLVNQANAYHIVGLFSGDNAVEVVRGTGRVLVGGQQLIVGDSGGSTGVLTIADNAYVYATNNLFIANGGVGTLNMNGGTLSVGAMTIGNNGAAIGTNNLNGGVQIIRGTVLNRLNGTGVMNFNGGTVRAGNNFIISNLTAAVVQPGGAFLDSSNYTITVNQALTGTGALAVRGSGTVVLNAANSYSGGTVAEAGVLQFNATNSAAGSGRNVQLNSGATVAAGPGVALSYLLTRIPSNALGTVAQSTSTNLPLDFSANFLTNVSLGAAVATTVTNSGAITVAANTHRLGGGGGTLVITNNLTGVATLNAFGSGSGGTLFLTGSNAWTSVGVNGGLVRFATTNAMGNVGAGRTVAVNYGGTVAPTGTLDAAFLGRLTAGSAGVAALTANNATALDLSAFTDLSLGALGTVTNSGGFTLAGTTYRLGGGGGTLVITNDNLLTGGRNLVAFGGGSGGSLILASNDYTGGTLISTGTVQGTTASFGTGAITNNGALVLDQAATASFGTVISGTGSLTKQNTGALTLTGANTYSGDTVLTGGGVSTLILNNPGGPALQSTNVTVNGGGDTRLRLGAGQQMAPYTVLTLTNTNAKFELNGFTQTVATIAHGPTGTAIIQNLESGGTGTALLIVSNNTTDSSWNNYIRNQSGALALRKEGAARLTLNGALVTYTGSTVVNGGILALSNTTAFASPVTVSGGQLLLASGGDTTVKSQTITNNAAGGVGFANSRAFTIGGLAGNSSGSIALWSGTGGSVALTVGGNNASPRYDGILSDGGPGNYYAGSVMKVGTGTWTLGGKSTYFGPTTITNGMIKAAVANALPNRTALSVLRSGSVVGTFDTAGFDQTIGSLSGNGNVINSSATLATLTVGTDNLNTTYTGPMSGSNALAKVGTGTLTLGGGNTYIGATTISGGTIKLQGTPGVPVAGSALWLDAADAASVTVSGGKVTQWSDKSGNGRNATNPVVANQPTYMTNALAQNLGVIRFSAANSNHFKVDLGFMANTSYSIYAVEGRTGTGNYYYLGGENAGSANNALHVGWRDNNQVTLAQFSNDLNAGGQPGYVSQTFNLWDSLMSTNAGVGKSIYLNGVFQAGATTQTNALLNGNNGRVGMGHAAGTWFNGDLSEILIYPGALSTAQRQLVESYLMSKWFGIGVASNVLPVTTALQVGGAGTLDLAGVYQTVGSLADSAGTGGLITNSGAAVVFTTGGGNTNTEFSGVIAGGIDLVKNGTGAQTLGGANTYTGSTTINDGTLRLAGADDRLPTGTSLLVNGTGASFDLGGFAQTVGAVTLGNGLITNGTLYGSSYTASNGTVAAVLAGSGASLTKYGAGTVVLTGNNTYNGGTAISNGTLRVGNGGLTGSLVGGIANYGTLIFERSNDVTSPGEISGTGVVVQNGTGTLTIPAGTTNTVSGGTYVSNGTLRVDGVHGGGLITVCATNATTTAATILQGTGTVGDVRVESGGIFSPGNSAGTLTVSSNVTMLAGSTLAIELFATNSYDVLQFSGGMLDLAALPELTVYLAPAAAEAVWSSYVIVTNFSSLNGGTFNGLTNGATFNATSGDMAATLRINYNPSDITLTVIPEPATFGLFGLSLALALLRRRQRGRVETED